MKPTHRNSQGQLRRNRINPGWIVAAVFVFVIFSALSHAPASMALGGAVLLVIFGIALVFGGQ